MYFCASISSCIVSCWDKNKNLITSKTYALFFTWYFIGHRVHLLNSCIFSSSILTSFLKHNAIIMKIILVCYSHFLTLLCLESIRPFNITKAKDNYNSEKYVIRYYVCISPYVSRENWVDVYSWVFQNMSFSIAEWFHGFTG